MHIWFDKDLLSFSLIKKTINTCYHQSNQQGKKIDILTNQNIRDAIDFKLLSIDDIGSPTGLLLDLFQQIISEFKKKTDLANNDKIMWSISRYEKGYEDEILSFNIFHL